ncbi:response regulator [Paracoccus tibetensis]|uniref:Response regulator receiver domain-containing protein n=1 Tax=Paracoccus tibetensis TaxID=336292 RepID=A0A1G5HR16_9RHOB|nr:response regulator [Paracoccus tibetensis]SCY66174.1 Response regulator receiver domain-containing protein [Paracoccus tibetensis]
MARILIVEDEMLVAMLLSDIVSDLGHHPLKPLMRLGPALEAAQKEMIDLAILDINLAGEKSFPVADCLDQRGIPFVFASGYGEAGLAGWGRTAPVIQKPYDAQQIGAHIDRLIGAAPA